MSKISLIGVVKDHFSTLKDARTGKISYLDLVTQVGFPILFGLVVGVLGLRFTTVEHAVAGISIVTGLSFGIAIFVFQLRLSLPQNKNVQAQDYTLIDEMMANLLWAILWGLVIVLYLFVCDLGGWVIEDDQFPLASNSEVHTSRILSGVAVAGVGHLVLVLAMCLKRLRRAYQRIGMDLP